MAARWTVVSHVSDKDKNVAKVHPMNEDLFVGTPKVGHPQLLAPGGVGSVLLAVGGPPN